MDRERVAVLSYWAGNTLFLVGAPICSMLDAIGLLWVIIAALGVHQMYFRRELAAHYAKAPRVWGGFRGNLRRPSFHLVVGLGWLITGLVVMSAWLLQFAGFVTTDR